MAKAVAESDAITIVGGGDSVAAINKSGLQNEITHISTGGGAALEMMEGKDRRHGYSRAMQIIREIVEHILLHGARWEFGILA